MDGSAMPRRLLSLLLGLLVGFAAVAAVGAAPVSARGELPDEAADRARVVAHWTPQRIASAIPRDLVVDERGLGYLRRPDGSLRPYGHQVASGAPRIRAVPSPVARPPGAGGGGGSSDATPPDITAMVPADGATIGTSETFSATVTDDSSGVKSVSFVIEYPNQSTQAFSASPNTGDTWSINFEGFSSGEWRWRVVATDGTGWLGRRA